MSVLVGHALGVVTMFRDEAPYLMEWVEYHLLAGVTRFWLYDHLSADASLDVLAPYVASGAVTVVPWPRPYAPGDLDARRRAQTAAIRDGLRQAVGEVEWAAVIDVDEFLLPMRDRTVTECLAARYGDAAGVYANWRMFGTGGVLVPEGEPLLDRLTACSLPGHPENWTGKSIVRPEAVDIDRVWYPHHFPLLPGVRYQDGGGQDIPRDGRGNVVIRAGYRDEYLRVNHYTLRDEGFYRARRLRDAMAGQLNKSMALLLEHHDSFSRTRDVAILDFLARRRAVDGVDGAVDGAVVQASVPPPPRRSPRVSIDASRVMPRRR